MDAYLEIAQHYWQEWDAAVEPLVFKGIEKVKAAVVTHFRRGISSSGCRLPRDQQPLFFCVLSSLLSFTHARQRFIVPPP